MTAIKSYERFSFNGECPNHGAEITREYTFGMQDATVYKFGCGCCAVGLDDMDDPIYAPDYPTAAGIARLKVAHERATEIR